MARSREGNEKRSRRVLYLVPVIAVLLLVTVYYVAFAVPPPPPPIVQNFSFQISVQLFNKTTTSAQFIFPQRAVGMRGGYWFSHVYDSEGLRGIYPIYSPDPTVAYPSNVYPGYTTIYVKSLSNRTYTLGDYFAVWGEALGRNNTLGFTSPPNNSVYPSTWSWHMCVGPTQGSLRPGLWGKEPLVSNMRIILAYVDESPCP